MARKAPRAARLPSGLYGWRGRAVPFSRLPQAEQHRFRVAWGTKAAATVRRELAPVRAAQREAVKAYRKGDPEVGRKNWENRDRSRPDRLYYYHARKGRK